MTAPTTPVRVRVTRAEYEHAPYNTLVLAESVPFTFTGEPTPEMRLVELVGAYMNGIMFDGHALYFENAGSDEVRPAVDALQFLDADTERAILTQALEIVTSRSTTEDDVQQELEALDQRFHDQMDLQPNLQTKLHGRRPESCVKSAAA